MVRYLITYFYRGTEICFEHFHPKDKAELTRFAMIKCNIYNYTYTTKKD